ncbi:MAG: hypothetical protein ACOZNI_15980 [Myxococcota bacterium]
MIQQVKFACGASSTLQLDWLSIQNGTSSYQWPPAADLDLAWEDVGLAAGGASNFVVTMTWTATGPELYAASDEGGVFWWDGTVWTTLNGDDIDLWSQYDEAVWDVLPVETATEDLLFALSGDPYESTLYGGLWVSDDFGSTWSLLYTEVDDISAYGRIHECDDTYPARAGGHLLAWDADNEVVFAGSHTPGSEGVYLVDPAGGGTCLLDGLTAGAGYPSSLVVTDDGSTNHVLLFGYKGSASTDDSLYVCDIPTSPNCTTNTVSCSPVASGASDGIDVRDIELDPADPTIAWVADGGRYTSAGTCTYDDGNVWKWDVDNDTVLDVTENLDGPETSTGGDDTTEKEVVGLTAGEDYLFAFFPASQDRASGRRPWRTRRSGVSRTRAPMAWAPAGKGCQARTRRAGIRGCTARGTTSRPPTRPTSGSTTSPTATPGRRPTVSTACSTTTTTTRARRTCSWFRTASASGSSTVPRTAGRARRSTGASTGPSGSTRTTAA